eukprot:UN06655
MRLKKKKLKMFGDLLLLRLMVHKVVLLVVVCRVVCLECLVECLEVCLVECLVEWVVCQIWVILVVVVVDHLLQLVVILLDQKLMKLINFNYFHLLFNIIVVLIFFLEAGVNY